MTTIRKTLYRWFLLIQEPRVVRIGMFAFYVYMIVTAIQSFTSSPDRFYESTGPRIVWSVGVFLALGGVIGSAGVLAGEHWLERLALVSLFFGFAARAVVVSALGISSVGADLLISEIILLAVRWVSIRKADQAAVAE